MSSIGFGVGYTALIALLGLLFGYPIDPVLIALAVPAAVAFLARGTTVSLETVISTNRRGTWGAVWCLGVVTALVVIGEVVSSGERIVIDGVLVSDGPQWIGALASGWPRVLVLVAVAALCGLRRGQEKPGRRGALGMAVVTAGIATACVVFGTALPSGLMIWAVLGHLLAFAVANFLLVRSGLLSPALLLAVGAFLAGIERQLIDIGTPVEMHLLLWPGYLAVALAAGGLEALGRRLLRTPSFN
jgi:hypothetical protein